MNADDFARLSKYHREVVNTVDEIDSQYLLCNLLQPYYIYRCGRFVIVDLTFLAFLTDTGRFLSAIERLRK
jgi:hypothetical protein